MSTTAAPTATPDLHPVSLPVPNVPGTHGWRIHVYAHTHWDREWYRTYERFRMQLVGTVDRILHALDADPRFATFVLDGQTIVLEDYLEIRPEEEPRLRRLIAAGRIEIGPWHVLPDEFLVSGESLVRNLLEGRRVASRFGDPLSVGYLPDPFGHVAQLPAVLRGFGIDNVIFSRGMGDEFARTGSEFRWEALDGTTDVLALVQTSPYTNGYCNFELAGRGNHASDDAPYAAARDLAPHLVPVARTDALLFAAGCDHETLQDELPDVVAALGEVFPDADVQISGLGAMVASVRDAEQRIQADGGALERYRGELRGSLHAPILASIFSARIPLKQDNDRLQTLLERHIEPLFAQAVIAGVRPARDIEPFLRHAWRLALENHPHDSIGGCSVDRVHDEMPARTLRAESVCHGLIEDLRVALGLGDIAVVHDPDGRGGIAQRGDGTPVALVPQQPGRLAALEAAIGSDDDVQISDSWVCTGGMRVRVTGMDDPAGPWIEVVDRDGAGVRVEWIDEADAGDEYDFGMVRGDQPRLGRVIRWETRRVPGSGVAELTVVHELDLPVGLTDDRTARSERTVAHWITSTYRVAATSSLAQIVVDFENEALDHRLRLRAVPIDATGVPSHVEALGHFAVVERPVRPLAPAREWKQDPPGLDHCAGAVRLVGADDVSTVLLAGRGIHEYEARHVADAHVLELTVLRSVGWLSRDDIHGRPGHAGPALPTPGGQCVGRHRVELAIGVAAGAANFDDARAFLATPMVFEAFGPEAKGESGALARGRDVAALTPADSPTRLDAAGIRVDGSGGAVVSACKLAEDGSGDLIARWWAPTSATRAQAVLSIDRPVAQVLRARLDESPLGPAPFDAGVGAWQVRPGAVFTVRVRFQD
jgi:mannosylglycerate hydrolase